MSSGEAARGALVALLALVGACGDACLRNSDCASTEVCLAGSCATPPSDAGLDGDVADMFVADGPMDGADLPDLPDGAADGGDVDAGDMDAGDADGGDVDAGDVDAGDMDAGDAMGATDV